MMMMKIFEGKYMALLYEGQYLVGTRIKESITAFGSSKRHGSGTVALWL